VMEALTACCKLVLKQLNKPTGAKAEKPAAVSAAAEPEPDIKLTDETPTEVPAGDEETVSETAPQSGAETMPPSQRDTEEVRTTEMPGAGVLELSDDDGLPEIEIDTSSLAANSAPASDVPDTEVPAEEKPLSSDTGIADAEIPAATFSPADSGGPVISCGEPQKISETAIKVPLTFKLEGEGKEGSVIVTLNFEDFKLD